MLGKDGTWLGIDVGKPGATVTVGEAMSYMQAAFPGLEHKKPSVLNPELSALVAWEIVWKKLLDLVNDDPTAYKNTLAPWLQKRILQVCRNSFAPGDKPPTPSDVLDILDPDDKPKPGPYDRVFSD